MKYQFIHSFIHQHLDLMLVYVMLGSRTLNEMMMIMICNLRINSEMSFHGEAVKKAPEEFKNDR